MTVYIPRAGISIRPRRPWPFSGQLQAGYMILKTVRESAEKNIITFRRGKRIQDSPGSRTSSVLLPGSPRQYFLVILSCRGPVPDPESVWRTSFYGNIGNQSPWISSNKPPMWNTIAGFVRSASQRKSGSDPMGAIHATSAGMTAQRENKQQKQRPLLCG